MDGHKAGNLLPYNKLFIYYFQGRLLSKTESFGDRFIGNWEEGDTSFLFFSESADDRMDQLLRIQPQLTLEDWFCMSYDEWHGEPVNPFRAGRFLIMPPWKTADAASGDVPIVLDPGVVFGAGTHPTTRDCLEAIEIVCHNNLVESSVDLGTGTGLLAIAAARLGCRYNVAVDNNFLAAKTARKNVALNNLNDRVRIVCGLAEDFLDGNADLLIANIHYDVMKELIIRPGFLKKKWFILSGLLRTETGHIEMQLAQKPVTILEKWIKDGVWHTLFGRVD
ncbi:MAG: methyltransferase [Desulfobacteraceae bacterium]|nr:50S ribosomal protein L11 methyltransferase [Desulfobacteraceae bacterium]MBC2758128.1 methyltransferase [Desulfobacteraceae bacterium]